MPPFFRDGWKEISLDVDPACKPDIVSSMTDMREVEEASIDAIYTVHTLEHLHPYDALQAMREFLRVLKADGFAFLCVPNLEFAARVLLEKGIDAPAYQSPAGPVTPLDMLYGGVQLTRQNRFMAHRNGFTRKSMQRLMVEAGFAYGATFARDSNLYAMAFKELTRAEDEMKQIMGRILGGEAMA